MKQQIETSNVFDILQKATLSLKSQKLDLINSVRNLSTKSSSNNNNIFGREFLKQQFCKDNQTKKKTISNLELASAMQKYNQLVQQKRDVPTRNYSKSQSLLNQLITKVTPGPELNLFKQQIKSPKGVENRPQTTDLKQPIQHKRQQSIGSKDLAYKKIYNAMMQKPKKAQSHQTTPSHSRQLSLQQQQISALSNRESKFFESIKFNRENKENQVNYYLAKVRQVFTKPLREDYFSCIYREHFFQTYHYIYVASYLRPVDPYDVKKKTVNLKKQEKYKNKITVIFDLDETLVHCNESLLQKSDIILTIQVGPNEIVKAGVNIRPGAIELLKSLVNDFEIIVFTASHSCYAQQVLDYLDPKNELISHRLFRDNCIMTTGGMYTKDLRIFDRPLNQLVLVDNAAYSYAWQLDNGIPIIPFYDNKDDKELWDLQTYLQGMIGVQDVREYNRDKLKLNQFFDSQGPASVFEKLFQQKIDI